MDFPHYPSWTLGQLEEGSSRGIQIRKGQQEGIPRESQKVAPRLACGYCGKTNHTEDLGEGANVSDLWEYRPSN